MTIGPILVGLGVGLSISALTIALWSISKYINGATKEEDMKNTVLWCFIAAFVAIVVFLCGCSMLTF